MTLKNIFDNWSYEDRSNFAKLVDSESVESAQLEEAVWQKYNGSIRPAIRQGAKFVKDFALSKIKKGTFNGPSRRDTWIELDYEQLLREASKEIKLDQTQSELRTQEIFFLQKLLVDLLARLPAQQRREFLEKEFELDELASKSEFKGVNLRGQVTTLTALSAAQASGFGVYLLSTTLLGALTHAIGITLPFAIYTGLTMAISVIIGPVGWTALGFSVLWKVGGPKWKVLVPCLLYIISVEHRPKGDT